MQNHLFVLVDAAPLLPSNFGFKGFKAMALVQTEGYYV
jgi:hypothetical protein